MKLGNNPFGFTITSTVTFVLLDSIIKKYLVSYYPVIEINFFICLFSLIPISISLHFISGWKVLINNKKLKLQIIKEGKKVIKEYNQYNPSINELNRLNYEKINIKVFMGTWCHDSKREVPRLIKILDNLKLSESKIDIVALTKDKKGYFKDYSKYY